MNELQHDPPTGAAAAAFIAAGIGCLTVGVMTILSEASPAVKQALNWYAPSGPLTGKAMTSIGVWLFTWFVLHSAWRKKSMNLRCPITVTLILVVVAFLATFPPLFELAKQ